MQAILTIEHRHYLVPCAKKALAFAEFMQKAKEIHFGTYRRDTITVRREVVEVTVETVKAGTKIITVKDTTAADHSEE
ncbi:MAG: hypothetical protein WAW39_15920 [Prosthecobacter sp.]|uniref:hypothetical protein n=1 Tax=Prosthecobacter sp. TaxID=1965333 RepID=UPI003BAF5980